jgi:hypothetical protein
MTCHFHPEQNTWRSCKVCSRGVCSECANFDTDKSALCPLCMKVEVRNRRMDSIGKLALYTGVGVVAYFGIDNFRYKNVSAIQYLTTPLYMKIWMAYCVVSIFLGWPHVERFKILHWIKPCPNFIPGNEIANKATQATILGFFFGPYTIGKTIYDLFTAGKKYKAFG